MPTENPAPDADDKGPAPADDQNADDKDATGQDDADDQDAEYWKKRAREWEDRAKRNAGAAKQWNDYQQSRKTDEQKAADERAAIEAERDAARRDARMSRAALKHGLTEDDLALLDPAGTDAEFDARAAALAERLSPSAGRRRDPNLGREHTTPAGVDWLRQSLTGA